MLSVGASRPPVNAPSSSLPPQMVGYALVVVAFPSLVLPPPPPPPLHPVHPVHPATVVICVARDGIGHTIAVPLVRPANYRIIPPRSPPPFWGGTIARTPPGAVAEALSAPDRDPRAPFLVALASSRPVRRAEPGDLHGPVARGVGATLPACAVSDADTTLHDAIIAVELGALRSNPIGGLLVVVAVG